MPIRLLRRAFASFHPASMPVLARANYRRELLSTFLFASVLAIVEGGVIGVVVRNAYEGVLPDSRLNFFVAFVMAAPEFANITSFGWAALAHGRAKVRFINGLQVLAVASVLGLAFTPRTPAGLWILAGLVLAARVFISGVITLRSTVWRVNYARRDRPRATGKFSTVQVLVIACVGLLLGGLMDAHPESHRVIVPGACLLGTLGVWAYAGVRVRGQRRLLAAEASDEHGPSVNPWAIREVVRNDRRFGAFMACLFVLGTGNLMLTAPLVIALRERFDQAYAIGIIAAAALPQVVMPLAIPLWARLLSRRHIVRFRSIHSWSFVIAQGLIVLAVSIRSMPMLLVGTAIQGVGYAGGTLAWNLGHLDFAPPGRASHYMGVHLNLNGIRGIAAPFLAVSIYEALEASRPGGGVLVFAISVAFCAIGASGFVVLARVMRDQTRATPRDEH